MDEVKITVLTGKGDFFSVSRGEMLDSTLFAGDLANGVLDTIHRLEQTSKLREQLLTMRKRE